MSSMDYDKAKLLIKNSKNHNTFDEKPASEELINKAENRLELLFPPTYKTFVLEYGYGSFGSLEIYGLIDDDFDNSGIPDVVWLHTQNKSDEQYPSFLLQIADVGDGFYYYLDSSKPDANGEYPVVIWGHGLKPEQAEVVYEDFGAFLLDQVKQAIDFED